MPRVSIPRKGSKTVKPAAKAGKTKKAAPEILVKNADKPEKAQTRTPEPAEERAEDILKNVRKFRTLGQKRVGMLFSGGPAPGANAVISTAAIQFLNNQYDVIGFYKGYEFLENFDRETPKNFVENKAFKSLEYPDVTKIRQHGGSMLRTSRANPSKTPAGDIKCVADLTDPLKSRKLYNVIDALEYMGISSLISIGGDDTLKTAYYLSLLGVPTVHVPKTIDNDYYGIPWTFGYFSAIERARQDLKIYNVEARTTDCYFVLELMGRKTGWYTLGAGIAGEAVRMIGPEEFGNELDLRKVADELVDLILIREQLNKTYGVILVSEGLVDRLPDDQKPTTTDQHGNILLSEAKIGEHIANWVERVYHKRTGREIRIKTGTIGYTTRCVEPSAFDVLLGSQLGMGAYRFVKEGWFGSMVSVGDELEVKRVPFTDLIDERTFKTRLRYVPLEGDFFKLAKSLEFRARRREFSEL